MMASYGNICMIKSLYLNSNTNATYMASLLQVASLEGAINQQTSSVTQ